MEICSPSILFPRVPSSEAYSNYHVGKGLNAQTVFDELSELSGVELLEDRAEWVLHMKKRMRNSAPSSEQPPAAPVAVALVVADEMDEEARFWKDMEETMVMADAPHDSHHGTKKDKTKKEKKEEKNTRKKDKTKKRKHKSGGMKKTHKSSKITSSKSESSSS